MNKRPRGYRCSCIHCGRIRYHSIRGLCWSCYHTAEVLAKYPVAVNYHERDFYGSGAMPEESCNHRPGTAEKMEVLTERAAAKQRLWHPRDFSLRDVDTDVPMTFAQMAVALDRLGSPVVREDAELSADPDDYHVR